ncbi:hypothetical protein [Salidesulfovibrio onnuriiensis]|uniref:hypothetical protein n=1 Tax=Salidesulfovibrio onnuriiensis TaxID=2583823 RepID=UPI0011C896A8|nr:hypothetical protein [Salidesulfovibrio onnuriiensis]
MHKRIFIVLVGLFLWAACILPAAAQETYPEDTVLDEVNKAMGRYQRAREAYEAVKRGEVPPEILERAKKTAGEVTPQDLEQEAAKELQESQAAYDASKVKALSNASGRSEAEIQAMRDSGKGWGVIAKELGVHPSALGKGAPNPGKGQGQGKSKTKVKTKGKGKK